MRYITFLSFLLLATKAWSQTDEPEFRLFEDVSQSTVESRRETRETRNRREEQSDTPSFILVGTSRIGDKYNTILQPSTGNAFTMRVKEGTPTTIPGFRDHSIVAIGSGTVTIRLPIDEPCREISSRGVACSPSGNMAILSLATADPLERAGETDSGIESANSTDSGVVEDGSSNEPTNPFSVLAARQTATAESQADAPTESAAATIAPATESRRSFSPRRIDPADVPPGMRVVSTPFGDRLVEQ